MKASSSKEGTSGTGMEIIAEPRREHGECAYDFGILGIVVQVRLLALSRRLLAHSARLNESADFYRCNDAPTGAYLANERVTPTSKMQCQEAGRLAVPEPGAAR
jgi:hypothetical protein